MANRALRRFKHSTEVVAVDCHDYGSGKLPGLTQQCGNEHFPVLPSSILFTAEIPHRFEERRKMVEMDGAGDFRRPVFFQERAHPRVEGLGRINGIQDVFVAVNKRIMVHLRNEVQGKFGVIATE